MKYMAIIIWCLANAGSGHVIYRVLLAYAFDCINVHAMQGVVVGRERQELVELSTYRSYDKNKRMTTLG